MRTTLERLTIAAMAKSKKKTRVLTNGPPQKKRTEQSVKKKTPQTEPSLFDAGKAKRDLKAAEFDHETVARPVWAAIEACSAAIDSSSPGDKILVSLMRAMRETHGSMCAVFAAAQKTEKVGRSTGQWVDMLLLARPQYDAAFVALLVAQDENTWVPKYRKAGWAAHASRHFFMSRRFEETPSGKKLKKTNIERLTEMARGVGVTQRECDATIATVLGQPAPAGTTKADQIEPLPTPGKACSHLRGGPYEKLGRLLYKQWKFLCDPAHVGIASIWLRGVIRGGHSGAVPLRLREAFIHDHVVLQSIIPSFVAIMAVVSLFGHRHRENPDLLATIVNAWPPLESSTFEGSIIWDGWGRQALGVLPE